MSDSKCRTCGTAIKDDETGQCRQCELLVAADSELSAIAHGRPPGCSSELLRISAGLREMYEGSRAKTLRTDIETLAAKWSQDSDDREQESDHTSSYSESDCLETESRVLREHAAILAEFLERPSE